MTDAQKLGSQTAKKGFKNEKDIVQKFNNWQADIEAQGFNKCISTKGWAKNKSTQKPFSLCL